MDAMSWLYIIGAVASVGGACVSIWQAIRSKTAADEASRVRTQLVGHRKTSEFSKLQAECKKAQNAIEKYGPGSVPEKLYGVSPEIDAGEVRNFMLLVTEHRGLFGVQAPNSVDKFYDDLAPILDKFSQSADKVDLLHEFGKQVLSHLNGMSSVIKDYLDREREDAH